MPNIDWTPDQGEEVRQILLARIDYLKDLELLWRHTMDDHQLHESRTFLSDMRELLTKLEAAYAND